METTEKTAAEEQDNLYQKIEEAMGQFMFLLFIPNSHTRTVEVYIDQGEYHTWYSIDEFVNKIKTICGQEEANRLANSCRELGVPFFYDREKKVLKEISEKPKNDRLSVSKIMDMGGYGIKKEDPWSTNKLYDGVKGQYLDLVNSLIGNEVNYGNKSNKNS